MDELFFQKSTFPSREKKEGRLRKSASLGIFSRAPMQSTVLDLHGLNAKDALDILQKKIHRAVHAGASQIKVLCGTPKTRKKLEDYLSQLPFISDCQSDEKTQTLVITLEM